MTVRLTMMVVMYNVSRGMSRQSSVPRLGLGLGLGARVGVGWYVAAEQRAVGGGTLVAAPHGVRVHGVEDDE